MSVDGRRYTISQVCNLMIGFSDPMPDNLFGNLMYFLNAGDRGIKLNSTAADCMCAEPRAELTMFIRSAARRSEPCVSYVARTQKSRYVIITERSGPATTAGFLKTIARTGEAAKLPFPIHSHMLRHSTGYKLANDGHDTRALQHYMGHKNIMHTVRYTEMAPDRFKNFWKD